MEFCGVQPPKPPDENNRTVSFRDKLTGERNLHPRMEKMNLIEKNLFKIQLEGGDRLKPKCFLDESILEELRRPMQQAIIVKLLGKKIGYFVMMEKLQTIWKPTGGMEIIDIGNGFFMVKFDVKEDLEKAMGGSPWMIFDHYLAIHPWTPDFDPFEVSIDRTCVWIRIPGLGMECYDENVLMALGAAIGRPIKVDIRTIEASRGKFARICVEIDLNLPVVGKIWFRNKWFHVEYEGLHLLCNKCGYYGHVSRNCIHTTHGNVETAATLPESETTTRQKQKQDRKEKLNLTGSAASSAIGGDNQGNNISESEMITQENYGEWLVVSKPKKKANSKPNLGKAINANHVTGSDPKGQYVMQNKYELLNLNEEKERDKVMAKFVMGASSISHDKNNKRSMDRKKRPRQDIISKKNTPEALVSTRTISVGPNSKKYPGQFLLVQDHQTKSGKVIPIAKPDVRSQNTSKVYELPHGIKTTMPAIAVSPNRLQFFEDTKPPDPLNNNTFKTDNNMNILHDGDGRETNGDEDDFAEMVDETPLS
jgi:hypothetical protein